MSLRHPDKKMSKSADDLNGTVYISDSKDEIMKKFKSSVTDSESEIRYDTESKQGISNLLEIYSSINNISIDDSEKEFSNSQYGEFKIAVGESVVNFLNPIQENFNEYSDEKVLDTLKENATKANESADKTISVVKEAIGLN